jgi:hypothetical protein
MIEALRHVRLEVDALIVAVKEHSGKLIIHYEVIERIQQLFLSWFSSVRPGLRSLGVQESILTRADEQFRRLIHLTGHRSRKNQYLIVLRNLRRVLVQEVLLDAAPHFGPGGEIPSHFQATAVLPEIPDLPNEFVPNALYGWIPNMRAFLRQYAFDRNIFIMVAYQEHLANLINQIREALIKLGLNPIVARDHRITDDLYNAIACLLCCDFGIAVFGPPEAAQVHNPNVVYELGMMQLLKRRCVILKHRELRAMPSDLLSRLYESYATEAEAVSLVEEWWTRLARS